jgi:hypothetical protein
VAIWIVFDNDIRHDDLFENLGCPAQRPTES